MTPRPMIELSPLIVIIVVGQLEVRFARAVGLDVAHVADVALRDVMSGMRIVRRIEMAAGRFAIGRRAIAEFVNVESMLARRESGEIGDDFHFIARFREGDGAFHVAAARGMQDCDGFRGLISKSRRAQECNRRGNETECSSVECVFLHALDYHCLPKPQAAR